MSQRRLPMPGKAKKTGPLQAKEPEHSRVGGCVGGLFIGLIVGWGAGQFSHFSSGQALLIHLEIFAVVFGALGAWLPEKKFAALLQWLR